MATFRVGIGSFNIKTDGSVGIGTEGTGHGNLKVEGTIKSTSADVLGVSTFTRYAGFNADEVKVSNRDLSLSEEYSTTGDIVVETDATLSVSAGSTACFGTLEYVCVKNHFSVPVGDIAQRNESSGYGEGTIRYNTDLQTMEFFNGNEWRQFNYQIDNGSRGRGVFLAGSGYSIPTTDLFTMEFITIASLGNSQDFGDLINDPRDPASFSSHVRGFAAGGDPPPDASVSDVIQYFTIASEGNAVDFGNLTDDRRSASGNSSSTRGIIAGGYDDQASNNVDVIDYVEMSTVGNAIDFGDLTRTERANSGGSNGVRALFAGGWGSPGTNTVSKEISMLTISTLGDVVNFGELTRKKSTHSGASNSVRCVWSGGYMFFDTSLKEVDYVTIASEGNAINFGELVTRRMSITDQKAVNQTRVVVGGGTNLYPAGNNNGILNSMEFITMASGGTAGDFGDLSTTTNRRACSDSHGGLGGY